MENVPRYGPSRSDHRSPDREAIADHDHPEDVSLLKLMRIIGRDEAFLAIGRDAASRHASAAEQALGSPPDNDPSEYDRPEYDQGDYDQLEFDADDPIVDPSLGRPPQGAFSNPAYLDGDDRGARRGHGVGVRRFKQNDAPSTGAPQLGHAFSELARLVGRIDSFLAAGSLPTGSRDPGRAESGFNRFERRMGGPASDGVDDGIVDDGEAQDIEMPVPSRHDRLTNDTDDPGLRLYAPRHKRRAAFVIARTDQADNRYGGATRSTDDRSGAARGRAHGHEPRQSWPTDGTNNYDTRRRRAPIEAPQQRRGGRVLTATAILAFTATAALYGYRTWIDPGSSHPGPIAAVAAPVAATTRDSLEPPAVDAPTNSGVSQSAQGVWSDLTGLLAPGPTLDSAPSASHISVGESAAAVTAARPQRPDQGRAHRSPTTRVRARPVSLSPIADEAASGSTNIAPPCEAGATRPGC